MASSRKSNAAATSSSPGDARVAADSAGAAASNAAVVAGAAPAVCRLVFSEGTSNKFWEAGCAGSELTVRFGRIGTAGQVQAKSFADATKAEAAMAKLVAEKIGKGYHHDGAAPTAVPVATTVAAPVPVAASKPTNSTKSVGANPKEKPPKPAPVAQSTDGWIDAGDGYQLTLREGKAVCRNPKGKELASIPPKVAESPAGEQIDALVEWLADHARDCRALVESWMLRSLPVPVTLLAAVWADPAWRVACENAVICAADALGKRDETRLGLLRGADPARGLGLVTLDGETRWVKAAALVIPHPVLLPDRGEFQALAVELNLAQGIQQLLRETHVSSAEPANAEGITRFSGGEFEMLSHATGRCRQLGYAVSGGYAVCPVIEDGIATTARYWIGGDDPTSPTSTGELGWTGPDEKVLTVGKVPPVAFSEGMRMASAVFAKRKVEDQKKEH